MIKFSFTIINKMCHYLGNCTFSIVSHFLCSPSKPSSFSPVINLIHLSYSFLHRCSRFLAYVENGGHQLETPSAPHFSTQIWTLSVIAPSLTPISAGELSFTKLPPSTYSRSHQYYFSGTLVHLFTFYLSLYTGWVNLIHKQLNSLLGEKGTFIHHC